MQAERHTEGAVQFNSVTQSCPILPPHGLQHARPPCPSPTPGVQANTCQSVMPSSHLTLCCPLLLIPSIFPSIRVFSNESALPIMWSKDWNLSFNISPSNGYSRLFSIRIDWFDLLAVQGTLKSLLQHNSSSISSSMLRLLYSPILTSIHYYQKNHSFNQTDTCWQSNVSAF